MSTYDTSYEHMIEGGHAADYDVRVHYDIEDGAPWIEKVEVEVLRIATDSSVRHVRVYVPAPEWLATAVEDGLADDDIERMIESAGIDPLVAAGRRMNAVARSAAE
jgi:hypothetical protein